MTEKGTGRSENIQTEGGGWHGDWEIQKNA